MSCSRTVLVTLFSICFRRLDASHTCEFPFTGGCSAGAVRISFLRILNSLWEYLKGTLASRVSEI